MRSTLFLFLLIIVFITSCDKFSFLKNNKNQVLDTIVDFSSVNVSPSFNVCDSIINKLEKTDCFRTIIHQKIGNELNKYSFSLKDSISGIVFVDLIINSKGSIILENIESPENIKRKLPALDSLLKLSVKKLPIIYPAIKRGIPVTTKYRLPIQVSLK